MFNRRDAVLSSLSAGFFMMSARAFVKANEAAETLDWEQFATRANGLTTYRLPKGSFRATRPLLVDGENINIVGAEPGSTRLLNATEHLPVIVLGYENRTHSSVNITNLTFVGLEDHAIQCSKALCQEDRHEEYSNLMTRELYCGVLASNVDTLKVLNCAFDTLNVGIVGSGHSADKSVSVGDLGIEKCEFRNLDFGILVQQLALCSLTDVNGSATSMRSIHPPHLLYTTDRGASPLKQLKILRVTDRGNLFSSSIKVRNVSKAVVEDVKIISCSRGLDFNWVDDAVLRNLTLKSPSSKENTLRAVLDVRECRSLKCTNATVEIQRNMIVAKSQDDNLPNIRNSIGIDRWSVVHDGKDDINGLFRLADTKIISISNMTLFLSEPIHNVNFFRGLDEDVSVSFDNVDVVKRYSGSNPLVESFLNGDGTKTERRDPVRFQLL